MTSTLHERLHRLAEQAEPTADGSAGADLWWRGRRYQRVRRAGTVAIAGLGVATVAAVLLTSARLDGPPPRPVPAEAPAGLPSRIHEPSAWLPGTAGDGPLGQVVAVLHGDRGGWFGSDRGVVGISAATGEYRFLDLPDQSDATEVALAPDGRHVAYWLTGETTDTPNTNGDYQGVATGVAVYDTYTGKAVRHQIETAHGLSSSLLAWVDDDTVLLDYTQDVGGDDDSDMDQSSGTSAPMLRWDLGREPRPFPAGDDAGIDAVGPNVGGRVVGLGDDSDLFLIADGGDVRRQPAGGSLAAEIAPDPAGTRIAAVWMGSGRTPNQVVVAALPRDGAPLEYQWLPRSGRTFRVLGWSDEDHLVVERRATPTKQDMALATFEVDARTGTSRELVRLPEAGGVGQVQWATDLLGAPVVDRPEPPTPMDPRLTTGLVGVALLGAGLLTLRWRRRVRP